MAFYARYASRLPRAAAGILAPLMNTFRIDDLARRLFESVPPALRSVQQDLEGNFRAVLRSSLSKLDLVTRDEFDVQMKVLERTRARLEALEERVKALEARSGGGAG
jgi:ubiquinone biosynthesis accessory factor UbiK